MNTKSVSIGIITRNRQAYLQKCLVSVKKQKKDLIKEIIVVDNGSSDNTKKIVSSFENKLPIRYIYEPVLGIPNARNRVLKEAKGKLLAFIDDDCEASSNWVEELVKVHNKYPKAIAIQGKAIFVPQKSFFARSFNFNYQFWIWRSRVGKHHITICDTANLLIQREKILALGISFDTHFTRGSDVDFGKALLAKKQDIIYAENAQVFVSVRQNIIALLIQRYLIGVASKKLENKWGLPEKISPLEGMEYKKRLRDFGGDLSPFEKLKLKIFFRIYKPFYALGRSRVKTIVKELSGVVIKDNGTKKSANITVAIVTRNRKVFLQRCLQSIEKQTIMPKEILIIDNASTDGTNEAIQSYFFSLPLSYVYEKHVGVAYARNRALQEAKGQLLAFIDDDCEASPNWIEEIIKAHKKYPGVTAIQGKCTVYPPQGMISNMLQYRYDKWIAKYRYGKKIFVLDTANASFKINHIKKKKIVFDTDFRLACDDIDFALRLWSNNCVIYYDEHPHVYSWRPLSKLSLLKQQFEKGKSRGMLDRKWQSTQAKNFIMIHNTKHYITETEKKEQRRLLSQIQSSYSSKTAWDAIKAFSISILLRWAFRKSYLQEKSRYSSDALYKSYAVSSTKTSLISVGIITRNRADKLKRVLQSLTYQTVLPCEVLIIDNASEDTTKAVAISFEEVLPIRYIYERQIGRAHARNRAMHEAQQQLLAFIDDDCEASLTWIEEMLKAHKKYPHAAAIQGRTIYKPENTIKSTIFSLNYEYWLHINTERNHTLLVVDTKNMLLQVKRIKKLGIQFDTQFDKDLMIGEDVDFAKQLLAKKQKIIYAESIFAFHYERKSIRDFLTNYYLKGKGKAFVQYKWPERNKYSPRLHRNKISTIELASEKFGTLRKYAFLLLQETSQWIFNKGYLTHQYASYLLHIKQSPKMTVDFSVCIVTKNRPKYLYRCLFSLVKQTFTPRQVIIVDSSDDPKEIKKVAKQFRKILSIQYVFEKPYGIGHARNTAIEKVKGKYLGFIDDDCEASPVWIEEMLKAHKKYPHAAAIQGKVFFVPFRGVLSKVNQDEYYWWTKSNLQKNADFLSLDFENTSFKTSSIKNKIFCDTRYRKYYYCDDGDFAYQLLLLKKSIKYYPYAYTFAKRKKTVFALLWQRYLKGRSKGILDRKWRVLRDKKYLQIKTIRIPLTVEFTDLKDNPFLIDNKDYVSKKLVFIAVLFKKLFFQTFHFGYRFERIVFNYNYQRLTYSLLENLPNTARKLSVSVMVITKDRDTITRTLDSLVNQTVSPKEVIVVDSSEIPIKNDLKIYEKKLSIRYIYQLPLGYGVARNTAMKKATGDIVATLDDDGVADQVWIENIIKAHTAFPDVIAVQGRIISMPFHSAIAIVEQLHIEKWFLRQLDEDNTFYTMSTKNISIKRKEFFEKKLKFVEERLYSIYGSEDIDMAQQLLKKKLHSIYEPSIQVYHWERSSIKTYLFQQYRKGMASELVAKDWKHLPTKIKIYTPRSKLIETVLLVLCNRLSRKRIYLYPYLFLLFFLANKDYTKGKMYMKHILKEIRRKDVVPITVIIVYRNSLAMLNRQLAALENQSLRPKKVFIVMRDTYDKYKQNFQFFNPLFPVESIKYDQMSLLKNEFLGVKKEIITIFDEYTLPSRFWIKHIYEAHKRYADSIIQGITTLSNKHDLFSTIMQFNKQSLIRYAMKDKKELYWTWVKGNIDKKVYVFVEDISNLSIKLKRKDSEKNFVNDLFFDKTQQREFFGRNKVLISPLIQVERIQNMNFTQFLQYAGNLGKQYQRWSYYDSSFQFTGNSVKKVLAFGYYCLRNRIFFSLPIAVFYFIVFQVVCSNAFRQPQEEGTLHAKQVPLLR